MKPNLDLFLEFSDGYIHLKLLCFEDKMRVLDYSADEVSSGLICSLKREGASLVIEANEGPRFQKSGGYKSSWFSWKRLV